MLWLISLLAWCFLFRYAHKHPIRGVSFNLRGGGGDDNSAEEAAAYEKAVAPNREYQALMNEAFKNYYMPYIQDVSGLWNQYGKSTAIEQQKIYQDISLPAYRTLGEKLSSDLATPWDESEMGSVYDKVWQKAQERTASQWAPIEAQTSQRLAGAGALETGAALKTGTDIEFQKYKSNESLAIEQAINEYNAKATAKQQSYSNIFSYLGLQPQTDTGALTGLSSYSPEVIPSYVAQEGEGGNYGGIGAGVGAVAGGLAGTFLLPGVGTVAGAQIGSALGGGVGTMIKY